MSVSNVINLGDYKLKPKFERYADNDRVCIRLMTFGVDCVEEYCTATINVPEISLDIDEIIIKNYSENEGVLDACVKSGLISEPLRFIKISDWVSAPICKLYH